MPHPGVIVVGVEDLVESRVSLFVVQKVHQPGVAGFTVRNVNKHPDMPADTDIGIGPGVATGVAVRIQIYVRCGNRNGYWYGQSNKDTDYKI